MNVVHYLRRAATMPPHRAAVKAGRLMMRRLDAAHRRTRDSVRSTFADPHQLPAGELVNLFGTVDVNWLAADAETVHVLADLAVEHRFDLLGSGWTQVAHGMRCQGLQGQVYPPGPTVEPDADGHWLDQRINRANLRESRKLWQQVDSGYRPIDWQLDFKSGWRWSEQRWSCTLTEGVSPASDVKVPWELARMQHLPQLVWAWLLAARSTNPSRTCDVYLREFRNQILDFISTNPPRFGVNWMCTMDVAIRVANWLVTYDLFRANGVEFDRPFVQSFTRSIYEHAAHIVNNLEWSDHLRSNHYLADLTGLLFAAAYLPSNGETDSWLDFAVREFLWESETQFHDDGSNFEGSTAYHRLSTEMVTYGTALILSLNEQRLARALGQGGKHRFHPGFQPPRTRGGRHHGVIPDRHFHRLHRMDAFTKAATRPDGRIVQIGDNDSGRFLKIRPEFLPQSAQAFPVEDHLDHSHISAAIDGILDRGGCEDTPIVCGRERAIVAGLCRQAAIEFEIPDEDNSEGPTAFPDFGLFRLAAGDYHVVFRCGPVGQNGNGGHAHNDQLSFACSLGEHPLVVDPGTHLYTPIPDERNRFRSTEMHNTLSISGIEQNEWARGRQGLFALKRVGRPSVISHSGQHVEAEYEADRVCCRRSIRVNTDGLTGVDHCSHAENKSVSFHLAPEAEVLAQEAGRGVLVGVGGRRVMFYSADGDWSVVSSDYSRGYGENQSTVCCRLHSTLPIIEWRIVSRE
ncbi:MAG: alginate lyase family protein [Planctomycetaceae bacterium]